MISYPVSNIGVFEPSPGPFMRLQKPDLQEIGGKEYLEYAVQLRLRVKDWKADVPAAQRKSADSWCEHIRMAEIMLAVELGKCELDDYRCFVYRVQKEPVGLMRVNVEGGDLYIASLVTSPASQCAGATLVEVAVNLHHSLGFKGSIFLDTTEFARDIYRHWGFESVSGNRLTLDPAESEEWVLQGGAWHLSQSPGDYFWDSPNAEPV